MLEASGSIALALRLRAMVSRVNPSFGILEIISSIEDEFRIQLDMATLDAEQITI
jgi:hypothetical protein